MTDTHEVDTQVVAGSTTATSDQEADGLWRVEDNRETPGFFERSALYQDEQAETQ